MFPLPETITVWRRTGSDGLGGGVYERLGSFPARIAYSTQKFTDINGDTANSTALCYTEAPVSRDDLQAGVYVLFADSAAVYPPGDADDVRAVSQTPSGAGELRKLWFA